MDSAPHSNFRTFSSTSSLSSSSNISRVPSGPLLQVSLSMNRSSNADDHLFYKCTVLLQLLAKIKGMEPYLATAALAAEKCAEQQALALLQQLQQQDPGPDGFRASVGSGGFSIHLDHSAASHSNPALPITNSIFTFTAGVLPANLSLDPATQLWKLFQQGVPLCLLFNAIEPEHAIAVTDSDDLRMCKKAVYDFLIAVKTHLNFDDEFMFTISNVFSESTHDLLKIVNVVTKLVDLTKADLTESASADSLISDLTSLKITDERSKVFRELIQTERKYVLDLELLLEYRTELQNADALSSEQLHVLFPNLSDIVDFHRRLLTGLECNINVPSKYQRIGSVFIHASNGPFRAYEPWTIGQVSAIELINKEAANLRKSSSLLDPGFELQSYNIKPIQRLCKYPLLLKELIKTYSDSVDSVGYNELLLASAAMKEVANKVNEAQRRAENIGNLQNLVERVKNWRGFNLREQGDLLYHSLVGVREGDAEKEYIAYLFESVIFFFVEVNSTDSKHKEKKKREILGSRKKSTSNASASTTNLLESLNALKEKSTLELRGRVYISEIYNITSSNYLGHTLVISWSGKKESGSFTLRFKTEEPRNQWESCLRQLKANEMNSQIHRRIRDSRGSMGTYESYDVTANYAEGSPVSQPIASESPTQRASLGSNQRHNSSSSTFSLLKFGKHRSDSIQNGSRVSSSSLNNSQNPSDTSTSSTGLNGSIRIKLIYNRIEIGSNLSVSSNVLFQELQLKISSHIAASKEVKDDVLIGKLRYKDEDGDFVVMDSADDWTLALDVADELWEQNDEEKNLTIWVS